MKKLLTSILGCITAMCMQAQTSGSCGDNLNWSYNETTKTLTITGTGAMTDYAATTDRPWNDWRAVMEAVVLPDGLTHIGARMCSGCKMISAITIPESVTTIGVNAFYGCSALTAINIPTGVTSLSTSIFWDCSSLTAVNLPAGLTSIGDLVFANCTALATINIPTGVTSIGAGAFSNCKVLTTINIPMGVTSIGEEVFANCRALTNITIPNTLSTLPVRAFSGDTLLTTVVIAEGLTSIGSKAFYQCKRLSSINLPESLTAVGDAFDQCNAIAEPLYNSHLFAYMPKSYEGEYVVPNGISVISTRAFKDCVNLTSVILPASIDSIGYAAFENNSSFKYLTLLSPIPPKNGKFLFSYEYMPKMVFIPSAEVYAAYTGDSFWNSFSYHVGYNSNGICYALNNEAHTAKVDFLYASSSQQADYVTGALEIPTTLNIYGTSYTVNAIGKAAFAGCTALTEVTLPATIDTLHAQCFKNCSSLTKITMHADHPAILQQDDNHAEYFDGTSSSLMFYVPAAAFNTYKQNTNWIWIAKTIVEDKIRPIEDVELFTVTFYHRSIDYGTDYTGDGTAIRFNSIHAGYAAQKVVAGQPAIEPEPLYPVGDANYPYGPVPNGYSYAGWEENFSSVTSNMKVHTRYAANPYTVTFKNYNDTILEEALFEYGEVPFYSKGTPHRDTDADFSYEFWGWHSSASGQTIEVLPEVTEDVTYTAVYTPVDRRYIITFMNSDGTILQQSDWQKNVVPAFSGETPTQEGLEFVGWTPEILPATADAVYTAIYKARVIFNDEWGYEWQNSLWDLGATPIYSGETPTHDQDAQYTYSFKEWPATSVATQNTTYTAIFDKTLRKYRVTFFDRTGEQALQDEQLEYGEMPEWKGGNLSYTAEGVKYNHVGWNPDIHAVNGEQDYYPKFSEVSCYFVTFYDCDGVTELKKGWVEEGQDAVAPTGSQQAGSVITGWDKDFTNVHSDLNVYAECTTEAYTVTLIAENGTIAVTDDQGQAVDVSQPVAYGTMLTFVATPDEGFSFDRWNDDLTENTRHISVVSDTTFTALFKVRMLQVSVVAEHGSIVAKDAAENVVDLSEKIAYGTVIYLTATPDEGYELDSWTNYNPETGLTVVDNITVTANFNLQTFQVTFVDWDDAVLKAAQTVNYGEAAVAPADPEREGYRFIGWDQDFSSVTANMTIMAQYEQLPTGFESVSSGEHATKLLRNGQILILRGDRTYTLTGQEVK